MPLHDESGRGPEGGFLPTFRKRSALRFSDTWGLLRVSCFRAIAAGCLVAVSTLAFGEDLSSLRISTPASIVASDQPSYYWKATPVGNTAQLLTLFCRSYENSSPSADPTASGDVPLVAVLRDTLGDTDPHNDRLLYVWLLSYVRPNIGQRLLSAVPFFYWRVGDGPDKLRSRNAEAPLLDLTTPEHRLLSGIRAEILQSSLLDPTAMPLRASSRSFRNNASDEQRLHLEETVSYLRNAPAPGGIDSLSQVELNSLVARLELQKSLLGGLIPGQKDAHIGQEDGYTQERIRSRNWEILRQCAERTGLLFEPLNVGESPDSYAVLWFPLNTAAPSTGTSLKSIWKLLDLHDPWNDRSLVRHPGPVYTRVLDDNGSLLPNGSNGPHPVQLVALAVYGLNYPKAPLLLADFRSGLHLRRKEMTQRAVNDVTAGIIGVSHFSNWYYYVGADLYDFVISRHGAAVNRSARLDCYAQFRAALALDHSLDPAFRQRIEHQMNSVAINPLEVGADKELELARAHYQLLVKSGEDGSLMARADRDRRAELAQFGEPPSARLAHNILHSATFGAYTHRVKQEQESLDALNRERRVLYRLNLLDSLAANGTPPEVAYSSSRIAESVAELNRLMPDVHSPLIRAHVAQTLQQLENNSQDSALQTNCQEALSRLRQGSSGSEVATAKEHRLPSTGALAAIRSLHSEAIH